MRFVALWLAMTVALWGQDYHHPPRTYLTRHLRGWTVRVEQELERRDPELTNRSLGRLDQALEQMERRLPREARVDLRQRLTLYLMFGPRSSLGGRDNGLEYFRADAPGFHDWLDPQMGRSVVIYSADNWVGLSDFWVLKALVHELGHARHLEHWPENQPDLYAAWGQALKKGLYQTVRAEDRASQNPNYAARNQLEYFAELTAIYFVGCDYYPHNRKELESYDPTGYALVRKYWGIEPAPRGFQLLPANLSGWIRSGT